MEKNTNGYDIPENLKQLLDASAALMAQAEKVKEAEMMRLSAYGTDIHGACALLEPFDEIYGFTNEILDKLSLYVASTIQHEAFGKLRGKGSL